MALYRDPVTGLLRSTLNDSPLPKREEPKKTPPLTLGRAFLNAPREVGRGALDVLRTGGNIAAEVGKFVARPLAGPAAILSEQVPALMRGVRPRSNAFSRFAFQDTEPFTKERGFANLSRGAELATFIPELLGAYGTGGIGRALRAGGLKKAAPILAGAGLRSAAVEAPFGGLLGFLDAKRQGATNAKALEQAASGSLIGGGIAFGLPFAGYGISRAIGPFIPSLSRQGAKAAESIAVRQAAPPPTIPARTLTDEVPPPALGAVTTQVAEEAPVLSRTIIPPPVEPPAITRTISDDVAERAIATSGNREQTSAILSSLRRSAPDVFDEFGEDSVLRVLRSLDEVSPGLGARTERSVVDAVIAQNAARRASEAAEGTVTGALPKVKSTIGKAKNKIVDKFSPIEDVVTRFERETGAQIRPQANIRAQIGDVLRAPEAAGQFLRDEGFDRLITEAERRGQFGQLDEYLVARQAEDIRSVRPEVELGRSAAQDRATIRSLESTVGDLAERVNQFSRRLLDLATEGGLVAKEAADELKKTYPNYVPIHRVFSVLEQQQGYGGRGAVASLSKQTLVQGLKGSERAIASPIESLVNRTRDTFVQIERNKAAQIMASYRNLPGNPFGIVPLRTADQVKQRISLRSALKESRPIKAAMQSLLRGSKKELRSLMVELRRLNVKGLKLALRRGVRETPAGKVSGVVNVKEALQKRGLPSAKEALERKLTSLRKGASDLRADLAGLNAEGYVRALLPERQSAPKGSRLPRRVDASLGRRVNDAALRKVLNKIKSRDPKLAARLSDIADAETRLRETKEALRSLTKRDAEDIALAERALRSGATPDEAGFAEIPATLSDDEVVDFVDSLIKLEDGELNKIKAMIARREPKLAEVLTRVERIEGDLSALNEARRGAFQEARSLADKDAPKGKSVFSVIRDGVTERYAIDKEFGDVIATISPIQLNILERVIGFRTRLLKTGATGVNIPFAVINPLRDQFTGIFNSSRAWETSNPYVFLRALFSVVGHDDLYKEAVRQGALTTSYSLIRNQVALNVGRERARAGLSSAAKHLVKNPKELFALPFSAVENVIQRGEELRRIQEFYGQRRSLLRQGASQESANIIAADEARRVTADFYRHGDYGRVLNAVFPYFNASIQSIRSFLGAAKRDPVKMAMKLGAFIYLPYAIVTAWNLADPKRKRAYDDFSDWELENNIILLPENPVQDADGRWIAKKIALPPNIGALLIPLRQTFEAAHGLDPNRFAGLAQSLIGTTSPFNFDFSSKQGLADSFASQFTPLAIKAELETITNRNFYTGSPIVPRSLEDLPPELQVKDSTSNIARIIGRQLDVSPLKVENYLRTSLGGSASHAINLIDRVTSGTRVNPQGIVGGESVLETIRRRTSRVSGGDIASRQYERAAELREEGRAASRTKKLETDSLIEKIRNSPSETTSLLSGLDYETQRDVLKGIQEPQLTEQERIIRSLGVEDGTRARYILELEQGMSSKERAAFENELLLKRVITPEVYRQIYLLAQQR